jgi:hypothetical protein
MGQWNNIPLLASDGPILVFTTCCLRSYTGSVHTIAASLPESTQVLENLLKSLFDGLVEIHLERASQQEELSFPQESFGRQITLSLWKLWQIEDSKSVEALATRWL